jgi:uncharacterized protein
MAQLIPAKTVKKNVTRRRWLWYTVGGVVTAVAGVGLYTWRIEPHWVEVVDRPLPVRLLPPAWNGRTIVQLSDLHVGEGVDSDYLIGCLQRVNALEPDVIVITGDWVTRGSAPDMGEAVRILRHLKTPPLGCFGILGNHDYGLTWRDAAVARQLVNRLSDLGIRVLRNQVQSIEGLQVVGIDDLWGPHYDAASTLAKLQPEQPALTLCHNPDAQDEDVWRKYQGWVLAGHTHGGQCKPPFLPPPMLPVKNKRYTSGEFELGNGRRLYINRGLGHLMRVRFNVRPEITRFHLTAA